jgi:hypothetical protein
MYKLFTTNPLEFKKHCMELNNIKQEELNHLVDIRDKYITNISSKRKDFENQYEEYMMKYSYSSNYIEKVNLFKTLYPIKKNHYNIYTYENYFELKELNETDPEP